MIDAGYVRVMARYNRWQNQNLYDIAERLPDEERRRERGAFFGSIHKTLNHLLWADQMWMSRFAGTPKPAAGIPERWSGVPKGPGIVPSEPHAGALSRVLGEEGYAFLAEAAMELLDRSEG